MNHRQALELLPDFIAGELAPDVSHRLRSHVEDCPTCREWLHSYQELQARLRGAVVGAHPSTGSMARWLVDTEGLLPGEGGELEEHLESCKQCSEEARLVAHALESSRMAMSARQGHRPRPRLWRYLAAAAGLGAVSIGLALLSASQPPRGTATLPVLHVERLAGRELTGSQVIVSEASLVMTEVTVADDSIVVFRAGDQLVLGDGFRVGSGTKVTLAAGGPGRSKNSS